MFCKYLRNESLDLHEILCGGQSLSCGLREGFKKKKVKLGLLAEVGGAGGLRGVQRPNPVIRYFYCFKLD